MPANSRWDLIQRLKGYIWVVVREFDFMKTQHTGSKRDSQLDLENASIVLLF